MSGSSSAPVPLTIPPGYTIVPRRNWKPVAGAVKMIALTLQGVGVIVSGLSIGYLVTIFNNVLLGPAPLTSFLNTLEAGVILVGVGAIVLGIAYFIESLA